MWSPSKRAWSKALTALVATAIALIGAEVLLRVIDSMHRRGLHLDYGDVFRQEGIGAGGYLIENFSGRVEDGFGGTVRWKNNSQGFRSDKEFVTPPPTNTYRVLATGDSFVGGYRVGQEQTFSYLAQEALARRYPLRNIEVMISVVEDPLTGLRWFRDHGIGYQPDLLIVGITLGNDLAQVYSDREKLPASLYSLALPEKCLMPREPGSERDGPMWSERLGFERNYLGRSRLLALIWQATHQPPGVSPGDLQPVVADHESYPQPLLFGRNGLGIFLGDSPQPVAAAYDDLFSTLEDYQRLLDDLSTELLIVIFPQRFQVQPQDWRAILGIYGLVDSCFDLDLPSRRILEFCHGVGLHCVDPTSYLRDLHLEKGQALYLPMPDMHWNARGHAAVAEYLTPLMAQLVRADVMAGTLR